MHNPEAAHLAIHLRYTLWDCTSVVPSALTGNVEDGCRDQQRQNEETALLMIYLVVNQSSISIVLEKQLSEVVSC